MGRADLLPAIEALYRAALEPEAWDEALGAVQALFHGRGVTFEVHRRRADRLEFFRDLGMPPDGVEGYVAYYHRVCPRLPSRAAPAGTVDYDQKFLPETRIRRHEFYTDFLVPFGFKYFLSATVANDADQFTMLAVHFDARQPHPERAEIARMRMLVPHVRRAIDVQLSLGDASRRADELAAILARLAVGAVLIAADGRAVFANDEARQLLDGTRGVRLTDGLAAEQPGDRARLRALLEGVASAEPRHPAVAGPILVGAETGASLTLVAMPLPRSTRRVRWLDRRESEHAAVVVFVKDATRPPSPEDGLLLDALGLTPAEARLARALVAGVSAPRYARETGVSHNTVRTQLARLRDKLAVRTQAEIVSRLSALVLPVSTPPVSAPPRT